MKNTIEGFEIYFDEETSTLLLSKKINGKERFIHIDLNTSLWAHLVEDDKEYEMYQGKKLQHRIKKSLAQSLNTI